MTVPFTRVSAQQMLVNAQMFSEGKLPTMEARNLFILIINNQYIKMAESFMKQSLQIVFKTTFY